MVDPYRNLKLTGRSSVSEEIEIDDMGVAVFNGARNHRSRIILRPAREHQSGSIRRMREKYVLSQIQLPRKVKF